MTIVYFGALVLGRQADSELGPWGSVVFVLAAFVASASWQLLLAGGGSVVGRILTGPRGRLATALVSSAVIVGLAVWLVARLVGSPAWCRVPQALLLDFGGRAGRVGGCERTGPGRLRARGSTSWSTGPSRPSSSRPT